MEDVTVRIGLLMEAVEAQRDLVAATLERLEQHAAGLDEVVREEMRAALAEELRALSEESARAALSLRRVARAANLRSALWSVGIATGAALVPLFIGWWVLPTPAEIETLRATRAELTANITHLAQAGGRVQLRHCGTPGRLCVRIEPAAPTYGEGADYAVVKGY
jgi:hypothetical protein